MSTKITMCDSLKGRQQKSTDESIIVLAKFQIIL